MRDAKCIARLEEFERRGAIYTENCILNFLVRRRVSPTSKQFVLGLNVLARSDAVWQYALKHNCVARLHDGKVGLCCDHERKCLHVRQSFDMPVALLNYHLDTAVGRALWRH